MTNLSLQDQSTEFLLFTAPNGAVKVEVLLSGETLSGSGVIASISPHWFKISDSLVL